MNEKADKQGWVKLYRKSLGSSVWNNGKFWVVWCWCLMKAQHTTVCFPFNGQDIELKAGQFITGRNKALEEMSITAQTYRTAITYLKSTSRITIKTTNRFSIITIINWEKYQSNEDVRDNSTNKLTNHQPATNQPLTTYKNVKNDNSLSANADGDESFTIEDDDSVLEARAERKRERRVKEKLAIYHLFSKSQRPWWRHKQEREAALRFYDMVDGVGQVKRALEIIQENETDIYCPKPRTPFALEQKWESLLDYKQKNSL